MDLYSARAAREAHYVHAELADRGVVGHGRWAAPRDALVHVVDNAVKFTPENGLGHDERSQHGDAADTDIPALPWPCATLASVFPETQKNLFTAFNTGGYEHDAPFWRNGHRGWRLPSASWNAGIGKITLESELGHGDLFALWIPRAGTAPLRLTPDRSVAVIPTLRLAPHPTLRLASGPHIISTIGMGN